MVDDSMGSSRSRRRYIKTVAGAAGLAGLAGCTNDGGNADPTDTSGSDGNGDGGSSGGGTTTGSSGSESSDGYTFGYSPLYMADDWFTTWTKAGQWYAEDNGIDLITSNPSADPAKQASQVKSMLNEGIDGLIISPVDSEASASIVDEAVANDVPVICSNSMSVNPKTKLFVAFDNYSAAEVCADLALQHLEDKYGEPRGQVLDVMGPQRMQTLVQRREGFEKPLDEYDGIEVHSIETDLSREDAQTKVTNFLRTEGELDVVYAANPNAMLGAQSALERFDMRKPRGEEGHVYSTLFAANPPVVEAINNGYIDSALNQTPMFYGPISIKYMKMYLDADRDDSVFPEIGSEVTSDGLEISGNEHLGVNPWENPLWAPAQVKDITESFPSANGSYPYFQTNHLVVDESNVNEPYLWGNLATQYD